jgi:hypothetical protein
MINISSLVFMKTLYPKTICCSPEPSKKQALRLKRALRGSNSRPSSHEGKVWAHRARFRSGGIERAGEGPRGARRQTSKFIHAIDAGFTTAT